ncbi:LuxR family transcriptional regulator [Kitasatospora sp. GP82]|uniref:LuxR family transcriptional regulator n=1 Tax=Kitasatospora sp. GP82 TaxID=3035089 RepID=UPI0024770932|nr:LuxR family transcriptional regulator [Kitasatospora sp. GP82]MDH6123402.1 DNA-binding CsgD family transcriptional regulator [Kitasatospora sp. GP82]
MLYGRAEEQAVIDRLLDGARAGRSGALVLRGEPGIGKSALLDYAESAAPALSRGAGSCPADAGAAVGSSGAAADPDRASGAGSGAPAPLPFRVIRATGIECEADLPFAGLSLLLAPGLDRLPALPAPQRRALEAAFGLTEESPGPASGATGSASGPASSASVAAGPAIRPTDRLLTGLATLALLAELATEGPLLCLIDDAQWLDHSSAEALLLAARRLRTEGVVLLFAARDGEGAFPTPGLAELPLGKLSPSAASALLAELPTARPRDADPARSAAVHRRVLAEAHGNPLALTELPAALADERPGTVGGVPLTSRLQLAFHGQVSRLPGATQTLLLVAAAEETGDLRVVLPAAAALGAGPDSVPPAERLGLVRLSADERLAFRHPLLRAAVLQRAPLPQRLAAHRAIGEALGDGDRRTWHLALAATGPDAELADALERTAVRSGARGGPSGAASAYERAARLTPDRSAATRRLVLAAESATDAGELERAAELAERALARTGDVSRAAGPGYPRVIALLDHVRATAQFWRGEYPAAYELLLEAAASEVEAPHAARMLFQAFHAAWYLGEEQLAAVLDRLSALELPKDDPAAPLAHYLLAAALPMIGRPAPVLPPVRETVAAARRAGVDAVRDLVQVCGATLILGRDEETYALAAELVAEARAEGAVGPLPTLLYFLAEAELFHGRHRDAEVTATEALDLARDTGQRQWISQLQSLLAYSAALAGAAESCAESAAAALDGPGAAPAAGHPWAQWALAMSDLGQGRAGLAADRLERLTGGPYRHHVSATRAVPDLVEAAVRLGEPERAAEAYERFARWAAVAGQPWAQSLVLRCQALLGPDELAEWAYRSALDLHQRDHRPFEQARTALLFGEWLRRERRRTEARSRLAAALEIFDRLGATPWADRARTELTATGSTAPAGPVAGPLATLTPQELQIVRLAAQGLTNRDIAAQLFLSPRTVGHHLYKAYPKLGVASRSELGDLDGVLDVR